MKPRKTCRRNIFIFSIAALALASVGFSSWIIGQMDADRQVSASVIINGPTTKVFIGEMTYKDGDKPLSLRFDDEKNQDLDLGLNTIDTIVSDNLASGSYKISLDESTKNNNKIVTSATDVFGRTSGTYSYLSFNRGETKPSKDLHEFTLDIDINVLKNAPYLEGTNFKKYSINVSDLNISYGSYFGFMNPQDFYDLKLAELKNTYLNAPAASKETARDNYIKGIDQSSDELNAFVRAFAGQQIIINIDGTYTFN